MWETIIQSISDKVQYLIMIVGCLEFIKHIVKEKKIKINQIIQIIFCIIASIGFILSKEITVFIIIDLVFHSFLFLSLSTLCYDLIVKKIKKEFE